MVSVDVVYLDQKAAAKSATPTTMLITKTAGKTKITVGQVVTYRARVQGSVYMWETYWSHTKLPWFSWLWTPQPPR